MWQASSKIGSAVTLLGRRQTKNAKVKRDSGSALFPPGRGVAACGTVWDALELSGTISSPNNDTNVQVDHFPMPIATNVANKQ